MAGDCVNRRLEQKLYESAFKTNFPVLKSHVFFIIYSLVGVSESVVKTLGQVQLQHR